jgi:hypothetical protein
MKNHHMLIALVAATALLTGCGGGGGSAEVATPAATDAVPSSASASPQGLRVYLSTLSATTVDTKEPLDLSSFDPKASDDTEPDPLI